MADCLNPRYVKIRDGFSGLYRSIRIRCGCCVNCLAAEQDSWSVRLSESCAHNDHFIYCTLTFRPDFFRQPENCIDVSDAICNPDFIFSEDVYRLLHYWDKQINNGCFSQVGTAFVPCFDKSVLSAWIKRGRERYFKDTGQRLHFKYLFTSELGPCHGRPHAHGIVVGLSKDVFRRYFADPWRKDFGFFDMQYIRRNPKYACSCVAVSHYISKYINKGSFESPLIKEGLVPKCWRMVSNGIGEELLTDNKYKFLQDDKFKRLAEECRCIDLSCRTEKIRACSSDGERKRIDFKIWTSDPAPYVEKIQELSYYNCDSVLSFIGISRAQLDSLCLYRDSNGFAHSLPRYYRYKLLGYMPNLFKYAVQVALQANARERYFAEISRIATGIECIPADNGCSEVDADSGVVIRRTLAEFRLNTEKRLQALRQAKRYYTHMSNHYKRPKSYRGRDIRLLQ